MSCGCKTSGKEEPNKVGLEKNNKRINGFSNVFIKILAFAFMMLLLPIIMLAIIWFIFELIVLNKEIDMKKIVMFLSSKIKPFNEGYVEFEEEDEDDEDDELTEENYEMIDVENITPYQVNKNVE
jgi:ATP-dependent Zn protease